MNWDCMMNAASNKSHIFIVHSVVTWFIIWSQLHMIHKGLSRAVIRWDSCRSSMLNAFLSTDCGVIWAYIAVHVASYAQVWTMYKCQIMLCVLMSVDCNNSS